MFGGKRQPDKRRSEEKPAKPKRPPPPDELEDAGDIATPEPDRDDEQRGL
ncbi:MAG: hypothetical protein ACTHK9_02370 [Nitrobacter sp.]